MAALFRLFFYLILWGLGLMFFLYLLSYIKKSDPIKQEKKIWDRLMELLEGLASDLIPMEKQELSELSKTAPQTKVNKKITKGFISTIFQEPVLAYAKEQTETSSLYIVAQDAQETTYALRNLDNHTVLLLDGAVYGTIDAADVVTDHRVAKGQKVFIDCNSYPEYNVIMMDETPIAYMDKSGGTSSNERFFPMINEIEKIDSKLIIFLILYCKLIKTTTNN